MNASSPLTILFVCPPPEQVPAPHGLIGGDRMASELLCAEVAACVAAVGHRLHVVPRGEASSEGPATGAALVLWGLAPGEPPPGDPLTVGWPPDVPLIPVSLDAASESPETVALPSGSRTLCGALARAARPHHGSPGAGAGAGPGRGLVLVHRGDGRDGDGRWPGLAWALTLLGGGRGRGLLVDAQGAGGSLSTRLRDLAPPAGGLVAWEGAGEVPVPGPALMARLPGAGGVRWWGWGTTGGPGEGPTLWDRWARCVQTARVASDWTVVDVGRDLDRAGEAAAGGTPVVLCTDRDPAEGAMVHADLVLWTAGQERPAPGAVVEEGPLTFRAADWGGASLAAWDRAARRRAGRDLAARIRVRLDQTHRSGAAGPLAGRVCP